MYIDGFDLSWISILDFEFWGFVILCELLDGTSVNDEADEELDEEAVDVTSEACANHKIIFSSIFKSSLPSTDLARMSILISTGIFKMEYEHFINSATSAAILNGTIIDLLCSIQPM
jgi:hypothetical protein